MLKAKCQKKNTKVWIAKFAQRMHNCQETMKVLSNFRAVFTRRKLFMTLIELIESNVFQIINQLRLSATVWKLNTRTREEFISSDDLLEPWQLINRSSQQKVDGENEIWNEIKLFVLLNGKCANPRFPSHPVLIKFCLFKRSSLKPCLGRDTKKVLINFNFKLISNEKWGRFIYAFCAIYNFSQPRRKGKAIWVCVLPPLTRVYWFFNKIQDSSSAPPLGLRILFQETFDIKLGIWGNINTTIWILMKRFSTSNRNFNSMASVVKLTFSRLWRKRQNQDFSKSFQFQSL